MPQNCTLLVQALCRNQTSYCCPSPLASAAAGFLLQEGSMQQSSASPVTSTQPAWHVGCWLQRATHRQEVVDGKEAQCLNRASHISDVDG
jgi:hypothetical protein